MVTLIEKIYRKHHESKHREGFAILEKERGFLFKNLVGSGKRVLDLGCRDGVITKYFAEGNEITGIDIDSLVLQTAREKLGIETLHFDVQLDNWPIKPCSFDVVVAGELLEHVYFPAEVVKRIAAILKKGGLFVGSVPNAFALKNRLKYLLAIKKGTPLEDPMHVNQFSWPELRGLLQVPFGNAVLYPLGRKFWGLIAVSPSLLAHSIAFSARK